MLTKFRYRLNPNSVPKHASIEGIALSKEWATFTNKYPKLEPHIKTKMNPNGMLDFEEFSGDKIIFSSYRAYEEKIEIYSKEVLETFDRKKLIEVAKTWGLDTVNKRDLHLALAILEAQKEYKDKKFSMPSLIKKAGDKIFNKEKDVNKIEEDNNELKVEEEIIENNGQSFLFNDDNDILFKDEDEPVGDLKDLENLEEVLNNGKEENI